MAFKVWDGFDHYDGAADFLARSGFLQWQFPSGTPSTFQFVSSLNGKSGNALNWGGIVNAGGGQPIIRAVWGARNAEAFFAYRILIPLEDSLEIALQDTVAASPQVTLLFSGSGYWIQAFRGSASGVSLGISANNVWTPGVPQFVEIHYKIDPSAGEIVVRTAGVTVLNLSGLNAQNTANAWSDAADFYPQLPGGAGFTQATIDDLNYLDTTTGSGAFPANTFTGDCRVATLFATGNQSVQWTPLANTNWQEVSETAMDGDTSYNAATTAGNEDLLAFGALSGIGLIYGIQLTGAYRKDDGGSRVVKQAVKSASTEVYGSNWSLNNAYTYFTDMWVLDPNTSTNWTVSGVNAGYYGYNLVS